ncbi:MAG: TRAP transporter small permease [Pararhodobacter sp.]|nr:TRAP transporter small permease [Pararhodobacter sp.]
MSSIGATFHKIHAALGAVAYWIGRGLSLLSSSASAIGALCEVLKMLHVTADVIGRYFFNAPLTGTIVIVAHFYMVILVFLAIGVAEEKRAHISVEIVSDLLPKVAQTGLGVFSGILTVGVISLVMIGGYTEAVTQTRRGATMEQGSALISVWPGYWAVPIGAGLMIAIAGYRVVTTIAAWRSGLNETDMNANFLNE